MEPQKQIKDILETLFNHFRYTYLNEADFKIWDDTYMRMHPIQDELNDELSNTLRWAIKRGSNGR